MKISPVGFALLGVISYLSYHAIAGKHGLSAWSRFQDELNTLEKTHAELLQDKAAMELKIARISSETLDEDYLEELARQTFHFVYPGEIVLEPPEMASQPPENVDLFALSN